MFEIDFDARRKTLHISASGMWTLATHAKFVLMLFAKGTHARLVHGHFAVLADLRQHPVQPSELNGPSQVMVQRGLTVTQGPIALVVGSMLGKGQAERVLAGPTVRVFLDHDEATSWLQRCWIDQGCAPTPMIRDRAA